MGTHANPSTLIFLLSDDVRAVMCTYEKEEKGKAAVKRYLFKTFDSSIRVDDYVVVPTDTRHGLTVVQVVEVDVDPPLEDQVTEYKWIIDKVDNQAMISTLDLEAGAIQTVKKAQKRRQRLELKKDLEDAAGADLEALGLPDFSTVKVEGSKTPQDVGEQPREETTAKQPPF